MQGESQRNIILVADDEPMVRELIAKVLCSYHLLVAEDATEALLLCRARTEPVQLAILDVIMPGLNGFELMECLRELYPKVRFLFISGYAEVSRSSIPPDSDFIQKPFHPRDLKRKVEQLLA